MATTMAAMRVVFATSACTLAARLGGFAIERSTKLVNRKSIAMLCWRAEARKVLPITRWSEVYSSTARVASLSNCSNSRLMLAATSGRLRRVGRALPKASPWRPRR